MLPVVPSSSDTTETVLLLMLSKGMKLYISKRWLYHTVTGFLHSCTLI